MRRLGLITATVSVAAVALIAPAAGQAATTIGQLANGGELADGAQPQCVAGRVYTQASTSGTGGTTYDLPLPTVITSWATTINPRITTGTRRGALKVLANNGGGSFTVLATSAVETLVLNGPSSGGNVNRFSARIPTPGGGQLAYAPADPAGTTPAQKCYFQPESPGAGNQVGHGPSSGAVGTTFTTDNAGGAGYRMSIQATFEPDRDVDGWGDESQDRCPLVAGDNQGCPVAAGTLPPPPPDTSKPAVVGLKFARSSFAAAKSGAAFTAQRGKKKAKKPSAPVGTKVSFGLTEAASVKFTVERKTSGRRVNRKCKTRTRSNRKKPKCDLWKKVTGSFTVNGKAGPNSFTFRGRIGGKSLKTGNYRLKGTATDAARNVSVPVQKTFKIIK